MPINIFNCLQEIYGIVAKIYFYYIRFSVHIPIKVFIIFNDIIALLAYYEYLKIKNPSN